MALLEDTHTYKQGSKTMTTLTTQGLKDLIIQVLEDYSLIMPYPNEEKLTAEPTAHELPPINEASKREQKIINVLNQISPDERDKLFGRYGYVKRSALSKSISKNILQNISDLKRAEKGDL